jgi:hypothetical protein
MEMQQTHCYATGNVTLLEKRYQRPNMSHYYGNAIKDLICHNIQYIEHTYGNIENTIEGVKDHII